MVKCVHGKRMVHFQFSIKEENGMANTLVVFYSRKGENYMPDGLQVLEKGNTAYGAEFIQKTLNADIFEIDTVKPYADGYRDCCAEAVAELE